MGAHVQDSRQVATSGSLTGGGDLSQDRTLQLSGDNAAPGNNMLYGTNGSGLKGWYVQPSGGSGGVVTEMVSGSAQTLANNTTWAISDPAVIQSGQTVTFPPAPTDAQTIMHSFGGQIKSGVVVTSLQYLANTGQTIIASSLPTQGNAGDAFTFRYKSSNNSWYRIS